MLWGGGWTTFPAWKRALVRWHVVKDFTCQLPHGPRILAVHRSIGGPPQGFPPEELSRSDVGATSGRNSDVTQHHHQQQPHAHSGVQHNTGFASPQSSALGGYGGGHALYTLAAPGSQPPVPYGQQGGVGVDQYGMNAGMGPGYVVYYDGRMQQQMAPPPHLLRGPQQLYPHQVPKVVVLSRPCTFPPPLQPSCTGSCWRALPVSGRPAMLSCKSLGSRLCVPACTTVLSSSTNSGTSTGTR